MIVAFILAPETAVAITLLIGGLASLSKHALRMRRVHIFDPAAVALLASIPLFSTGQSWWRALPDLPWSATWYSPVSAGPPGIRDDPEMPSQTRCAPAA